MITPQRPELYHRAEELASSLPPLLVAADRVATTVSQGVHGRRRVGQGEVFWQFRRYQPGESIKHIDWRQSAKSQPLYVRENEWAAAQSVWLWRDGSPSMDYASVQTLPKKRERADLLMLALASLLIRGGERVTALGSGLRPASGRAALHRLAAVIAEDRLSRSSLPVLEPLPRHCRVVLFGDFLSPLPVVKAAIDGFVGAGVRGHLLQITDPAEEALPFAGRILFEGMEADGDVLFGRVESVRSDYRDTLAAHRRGLDALTQAAGWTYGVHHTDRPPQEALLSLYVTLSMPIGATGVRGHAGRR